MRYLGAPCTLPYICTKSTLPKGNLWACMSSGRSALEAGLTSGSAHVKVHIFIEINIQYSTKSFFYVNMNMIMIMIIFKTPWLK